MMLLVLLAWAGFRPATAGAETIFTTQIPAFTDYADGVPYEMGVKFQSATDGTITAIRYWKAPSEPAGNHTGHIWDSAGNLLASVGFTGEGSSGWQQQALATPLSIQAGKTYVVTVNIASHYPATVGGLTSSVVNGDLSTVADGQNGLYGPPGLFPTKYHNNNYFRDVVFVKSAAPRACITGEKYVSTNGLAGPFVRNSVTTDNPVTDSEEPLVSTIPGSNGYPSPSVNIPTAFFDGNKVVYKFVFTNCGNVTLHNVIFDDCVDNRSVGDSGFLQGGADGNCGERLVPYDPPRVIADTLEPGASVTVTSADFPLDPISYRDICNAFAKVRAQYIVRNDSEVEASADLDGNGVAETSIYFDDLNLVQCTETPQTAALGDRVWKDLNGNGIQDCTDTNNNGIIGDAGDVGAECAAGIPGVSVNLVNCQNSADVLATTTTDANGFYLFSNLTPGQYCVQFNLNTVPASVCTVGTPQFTGQNVGSNDAIDSDANPATGITPPVTLASGETNRTVDAGIVCSTCQLLLDKTCLIQPPPSPAFVCSNAKPIDSLTMIWTGQDGIYIKAWKGTVGSTLLATKGPINKGDKVTVTGMGGSPLDQFWEIFSGFPDPSGANKLGESEFHISCSDVDMNGPEDCGKLEGNAKTTSTTLINLWIFDGMAGNGQTLTCTPASTTGEHACSFVAGPAPSCKTLGVKPKTLTFKYTGSDCSASNNTQASDKWFCSGVPGANPTVSIVTDPTKITVSPTSGLKVGDLITVSAIGSDMGTEIQLQVGGQSIKIHTSCSQPLGVGDVFGSLQLVQFNGQGAGSAVTYQYGLKNSGSTAINLTSVFDDKLGELLQGTTTLAAGGTLNLEKTAFITATTTNTVTATARLADNSVCNTVSDHVTVTVTKPTCAVSLVNGTLSDTAINYTITNNSSIVATLDTFMLNFPASYGLIKEIRLDGSIFLSSASVPAVPSGATISGTGWTNPDITKRQLDPHETRTLQIIFTKKGLTGQWAGISDLGGVTFKEGCQAAFPSR